MLKKLIFIIALFFALTTTALARDARTTYVSHPKNCPKINFCACGASVKIFGKPIRSLWQARSWFRFPKTSPASNMVAVRRHHVFVLLHHLDGSNWMVWDANSGGHRTRIHPRSIRGYTIVNPH